MKRLLLLIALFLSFYQLSVAQCNTADIPSTCDNPVEDFTNFNGSGFAPMPTTGQLCSDRWAITGFSDGDLDFGDTNTSGDYARGDTDGGVGTGGLYGYDDGNSNQAIWIQATGSDFNTGTLTYQICNNSGTTLQNIEIQYDILAFNDQNRSSSFNFSYSIDDTNYTTIPSLDFTSDEAEDTDPQVQTINRNTTIENINLADGVCLFLRWTSEDVGGSGSRDELGLDNIFVCEASVSNECAITNVTIQNAACQDEDYVFEVTFDEENSSGNFEVFDTDNNTVLASGTTSPITVTLSNNTSTTPFNIIVRDENDNSCASENIEVTPDDCSPLICANAGDLVITEIIQNPDAVSDANGEWFELYNPTANAIDLKSYIIRDSGSDSHEIANSVIVPAGGYVVLARNANNTTNGGFTADYEYSGFTLVNSSDEVIIECNGVVIDSVGYDDGATFPDPSGASMSLNPNNLNSTDNDNGANWCEATSTYGDGDLGTPGAANDACAVCEITNIAIQNAACQGEDYVFEVAFDASNSSGEFEVFDVTNNTALASGTASPIEVILVGNISTTPFNIIVRDTNDNTCASEEVEVTPADCTPPCEITNIATQNESCQGEDYIFEVAFEASNSSGEFEVFDVTNNTVLASGNTSPIEVTLIRNTSTTPFNIIVRDANDNSCASEEVEVTPEDCTPPCEITNVAIQNATCQDLNYVFEVTFNASNSSDEFEVINADDNTILASGTASPIEVILANNSSTTPINIIVRDATDNACQSESVDVTPEDCVASCMQASARINEFHYDNDGADVNEFVEIFIPNPQPTNLSEYQIDLYNGNDGEVYETVTLDQTIVTSDANGSYYVWEETLQNGPDGIALSGNCGLIEFISYEGVFTATEGVANGIESTDIGVEESPTEAEQSSIQLINGVWQVTSAFNTKGAENALPPCEITNTTIQNASCQGEDYVFEVTFDASNSSGDFEIFDVTNNLVLASGTASPIEVTLVGNTSTTPFNIIVRDANDNTCASEEVEVTPEDCTPPCEITNIAVQNAACQGEDYVFEVTFNASNSSGEFEVFDVTNNTILASGNASPIEVTLVGNVSTTPFNIIVRDANDDTCASEEVKVTPEDCTPPCEITNVTIQSASCQNLDYIFEVAFDASNSSGTFEVINTEDNTILASGTTSPIEVVLESSDSTAPINIAVRDASDTSCQSESVEIIPEDCVDSCMQADARINEFHYDDDGADVNEFVEIFIASPQPSNLSEYRIDLYNGSNGTSYNDVTLDMTTITSDDDGSYYVWNIAPIQNGPDGIALSGPCGLIEFLSYEGTFVATEGVADGVESVDVGVEEDGNTPENSSIQLIDSEWILTEAFNTKGKENALPPCEISNATIQNAGCQGEDYVFEVAFDASNSSGEFEVFDVTNNLVLVSGMASPIKVTLVGNTSTTPFNITVRDANNTSCASEEVEVTPEDCTPPCEITNAAIQNAACQGEDYVFEVAFEANNSSGDFEVFDVTNDIVLASGNTSLIEVTLLGNTSTTPFNIIVRDANNTSCASEEVEVTPEDCTPPCEITNAAIQNAACQGKDYVFEVAFEASNSSGDFEVFDVTNDIVLASGNTSPITVTLVDNTSKIPFNIIVRDANDNTCASEEAEVTPEDCTPPCEITNVTIQNASCQNLDYVFEVAFDASNSSSTFEVINADDNTILASGMASPIEVILANNSSTAPINIAVRDANNNICQSEAVEIIPEDCVASCMQANARINEFHYNNDGADINEFVEIFVANPQPSNLSEYRIDLYNGSNGTSYNDVTLDITTITSDDNGSYYVWNIAPIQNGPDGIALSGSCGLIEFLSYEGTFVATEGVANGIESVDVGVEEDDNTPENSSIQLIDGDWILTEAFNTKGEENALPPCEITNVTVQNAVCQGEDYIFEVAFDASNSSGDFEVFDVTNNTVLASGTASPIEVILVGNTSTTPFNIIVRDANDNSCASEEVEVTPEDCTPPCEISNIAIQNGACQDADYVFEVTFDASNSSGTFEVVNATNNSVLAAGNASPITVTLIGNTSTEAFNIFVRDADDNTCASEEAIVIPEDCTPLICANVGDLVITEILPDPDVVNDTNGEWFEVYNATDNNIDLKGYIIRDAERDNHEISSSVIVPANGYIVLGRNVNTATNGNVAIDYEYETFILGNEDDEIILECNGVVIDSVGYDGIIFPDPEGASINLNPENLNATDNDNGENWCEASSTFGDGDLGTPGAANDACPACMISNLSADDLECQEADFVFEVTFDSENSSDNFEVIRVSDEAVLATGSTSPIVVTITNNVNTTPFEIFVRDAEEPECVSDTISIQPLDCTPLICANIGDLIITEILPDPNAVDDEDGEWFEIYNATDTEIDLKGYIIRDASSNRHEISSNVLVPAKSYVVLGRNADLATNGGVNIAYEYSSFNLNNSEDQVILECDGSIIDSVGYDGGLTFPNPTGASISLNPNNLDADENDNGFNWCEATSAFGDGDLGTPGATNDACPVCEISEVSIKNTSCEDADFTFEVAFETNVKGGFEVIQVLNGNVLASGNSSPLLVTLEGNTDTTSFEIFVQNRSAEDCKSETIRVSPFDCTPPDCVAPSELIITEIMQNPAAVSDENGEWFEIYNASGRTVNLKNYVIRDADGDRHIIAEELLIDSASYVVLARNSNFFLNGQFVADYEYGNDIILTNTADEIIIECSGVVIDSVGYDEDIFPDPTGASMNLNPDKFDAIENDNGESWCEARFSYGIGDLGTPGRSNTLCEPCSIVKTEIENAKCTEEGFVFEVSFVSMSSSRNFEVVQVGSNSILATGNSSPIIVLLPENQDTTSFEIFLRDVEDERCISPTLLVSPLDCIPFDCTSPGDLIITEIHNDPVAVADSLGEWFELYNNTSEAIDLEGYVIRDADNDFHEIDTSLVIQPMSYLVFGINDTLTVNGGVEVDYVYDNFTLGNGSDEVILECQDTLSRTIIDIVAYDEITFPNPTGASINLNPNLLTADNNNGGNWCVSSSIYGSGDAGTPGEANDGCPTCEITNANIQDDACRGMDFVFEVHFEFAIGNGDYEIVRTNNGKVLAVGSAAPILVTLPNNRDNSDFEIIVRNVFDETCQSEALEVDAKNCVDPCDIEVASTRFTLPFCEGNNDGSITINATASLPLIYSIDGGTTFQDSPTFTNLESGDYNVVVKTVGLDDCEERYTYTLMEGPALELDAIIKKDESCAGANDGRIEIYAKLFIRELLYSIDGGTTFQSDNIFTGLPAGDYEIVVKAVEEETCVENFGITTIEAGMDNEAPTFICPGDVIIGTQATRCGAVVQNIGLSDVTDNCDASPNITYKTSGALDNQIGAGDASGSVFPFGTTFVTYFVEDESGNIDSCKFSVTVEDDDAPIAQNCPSDIIIENATDFYRRGGTVTWTPPTFTDNCTDDDQLLITNNIAPDFIPDLGVTTIIYTATDEAGNSSRCTFDIIVQDIYITAPCICLDNRTNGNNGQFAEMITVYSATNETWRIVGVEGLFRAPLGTFPPASSFQYNLVPYQIGDELTGNGEGEYTLNALHLEEIGYQITVSNGSTTLSTSNSCTYDIACDMGIAMPKDGGAPKQYTIECGKETGFFDDGGTSAPYFDEEDQKDIILLCPEDPVSQVVQITFQAFDLATGDRLIVYDGNNLAAPSIGSPTTGTGVAFSPGGGWVQASCENVSGCLTVEMDRNGDNRKGAGWEAIIECAVRNTRFSCPSQTRFVYGGNECNSVQNVQLPIPFIEICGEQREPLVEFSCNGVEYEVDLSSNSLKINTLPVGKYSVLLSDPVYPSRFCTYDLTVLPESFACNDAINISLSDGCTVALTPDLVLENPCENLEIDYRLEFADENINVIGTTVNGHPIADFSSYACGTRIPIKISRSIQAACGEIFEDACWSHLVIEDKIAPELIGGIDEDVIYCYDDSDDLLEKLNVRANNRNGETITLTTGNQLLIEAIDNKFSIIDNCEADFEISNWQAVEYDCTTGAFSGLEANADGPLWALMMVEQGEEASFRAYFRTITAIDKCGNESNIGLQRVLVVQPDIVAPLLEIELPCDSESDPIAIYNLWKSGEDRYAHYRTFLPNYDPTPLDLNGDFGGFAGLEDNYFTNDSGDEIPAALEHENCGYAIDWVDSDSTLICEGTYKFFREWTVYNWCDGHLELIDVLPQTVKVGDLNAPTLEFVGVEALGNNDQDCSSDALIRVNVADDCDGEITAYIDFLGDDLGELEYEIGTEGIRATNVPVGDTLRFEIRLIDACGNSETYGPFADIFEDIILPVAICESFHSVTLGLDCTVEIPAEVFDDGSYDNCGTVSFSVAKMSDVLGDGVLFDEDFDAFFEGDEEVFQPRLLLTDEDLEQDSCSSIVPVIFRVEDGAGNANFCMLEVEVADKLAPVARPMPDYRTTCGDPVIADITELLLLEEEERLLGMRDFLLTGALGELTITENCGTYELEVTSLDLSDYNFDCNDGTIRYRFRATDNCGRTSLPTTGRVIVDGDYHDWQMNFPRDAVVDCDDRFVNFRINLLKNIDVEDIVVNNGCDHWTMEVTTERFDIASEGCYELICTYNLINHCTWDPRNVEPAVVERPDSLLDEGFETISLRYQDLYINDDPFLECGVQRDLDDCENIISPEGRDGINDIDDFCDDGDLGFTALDVGCDGDFVLLQPFDRPYSGDVPFYDIFVDSIRETQRYVSAQAYGNIIYRQIIRVYDSTAPTVEVDDYESVFCGGDEEPVGDLCLANAEFTFEVEDACLPEEDINVSYQLRLFDSAPIDDPFGELEYLGEGKYRISGQYPIQAGGDSTQHTIVIRAEDDCSNSEEIELPFTVVDCKAPTPYCIFGQSADLMDNGTITLWASDFDAGSFDFCTPPEQLKLTLADPRSYPDSTSRTFRCQDGEIGVVTVELWAQDLAGNVAFCETFVNLTNHNGECPDPTGTAFVSGIIRTEKREPTSDVEVKIGGSEDLEAMTNQEGEYGFYVSSIGGDYSIAPSLNDDPLNGVSTYDIVLISKHILNVERLDSPYKMIAADANNSGSITTFDMVLIRKLILGIDQEFTSNTSWRFVDASHAFSDPVNPFIDEFPEIISINDLEFNHPDLDFVSIKVGDVNDSAIPNANTIEARSIRDTFTFEVVEQQLNDNLYRLDFTAPQQQLEGYQFTLDFNPAELELIEILEGSAEREHFGQPKAGKITVSWDGRAAEKEAFSLLFKARTSINFAKDLQLTSSITTAEAYLKNGSLQNVGLEFIVPISTTPSVQLHQNTPNPFDESTIISFDLQQAQEATLEIRDVNGRLIYHLNREFEAGENQVKIDRKKLITGVLHYILEVDGYKMTKRMVMLE